MKNPEIIKLKVIRRNMHFKCIFIRTSSILMYNDKVEQ